MSDLVRLDGGDSILQLTGESFAVTVTYADRERSVQGLLITDPDVDQFRAVYHRKAKVVAESAVGDLAAAIAVAAELAYAQVLAVEEPR